MKAHLAAASAPASIGNAGVGFDVLGLAFDAVRDTVRARAIPGDAVRLGAVTGLVSRLPESVERNTALRAARAVLDLARPGFGVEIDVDKRAPMSAGMGGSAASAVAAALAVAALVSKTGGRRLGEPELLACSIEGERASADPPPWDNVMASLLGGLVIAAREDVSAVRRLDAPRGLTAVLVHPALTVETQAAREALAGHTPLATAVEHARRIAAFTAGCAMNDHDLIRLGLEDVLVEPQRAHLVPGLADVKAAAIAAGALGGGLSGSGPSVFALVPDASADAAGAAMRAAFASHGIACELYRSPLDADGAREEAAK